MSHFADRQTEKVNSKWENVKNSVHEAKLDLKDRVMNEHIKNYERNVDSKVKAFNDKVDNAPEAIYR